MDQPLVTGFPELFGVPQEVYQPLRYLPSALAGGQGARPFVALAGNPDELLRWLVEPPGGLQWIEIEGLLDDLEAWAPRMRGASNAPLDVVLTDPAREFANLYGLVDVCATRDLRVTVPAAPGFLKAVKLAASLRFPIRLLPGQPTAGVLAELTEALEFYLHGPMVETPVEFFHSLLATACGADRSSLWMILEEDPVAFLRCDREGRPKLPRSGGFGSVEILAEAFVENRLKSLLEQGAECKSCPWQQVCRGYFKWPDPAYSCAGVKRLFSLIGAAADEMKQDLASIEEQPDLIGEDRP
jgi:hypothetical protein